MKKRRNWIYKNSEIRLAAIAVERAKESMMKTGRIVFFLLAVPLASEAHILQPKTSHGQTITTTTSTWLIFKRQEEDKNENSSLTRLEWERKTGFLSHRAGVEFFPTFFFFSKLQNFIERFKIAVLIKIFPPSSRLMSLKFRKVIKINAKKFFSISISNDFLAVRLMVHQTHTHTHSNSISR